MRYKSYPISVLRIGNFVITNDRGYRAVKRKWKDAPFVVTKSLSPEDLRAEMGDVGNASDDDENEDDPELGAGMFE